MNWHVLYTKSRFEKQIAEKLSQVGITNYCPLLKTKKKWSDRWKWVEEPLFKSYCFVQINEVDRDKVFFVKGVVRYLFHSGKPAIVRQEEIDILKNWLNAYDHTAIESVSLGPKDKVMLRSGILIDKRAEVVSSAGHYLDLILENMGMHVRVDLRKNIVDKVSE